MKTGVEVFVGGGIACPARNKQYPSKHLDRVFRQVGLTKKCAPYLVVTDNVPPMQSVLIAKVRDELRNRHASPCPWDDASRVDFQHVCNQGPHPRLFNVEATQKIVMFHGSERCLPLFKGTGLWNRVTLQEWIEMPIDLHRNSRDMCGDVMGCPSVT
jgi:hypothetical protein